ncbi:symmetrical bis(5'-nucleosyl)-tetraphosphatase [Brachymonas denitrificans]|jgi:bis(5'-nucleosyl)-tetraphosphatase (symmetrical)|uniref:bis(5'-nucleosyl)-tetraphosphatase (symmetrical) n=1 Tax=Brachymonas denitrificans DSM 15123 TaxID=1121117 RepID=A0A1H8EW17_9BURK|nr:symmetrical bis(5'-nucleosyl)-tetraphosphatase [Brachymonas denitrificans]SEN23831.1 Bis(5'nucleosyl)-tetraphosphatase, ApaH [Brachymonas denitrificans DSM 15123]
MLRIMAMYCIGDIQGCDAALADLLDRLAFSPSRDSLYVLGDLVNRGPASASVLRRLMAMDGSAFCLLGNHDIHLLAVSQGIRQMGRRDTLTELLVAPDAPLLLDWLRRQPLALYANRCLMVHAGVQPQWDVAQTLECAAEVAEHLRSGDWTRFLSEAFGNHPALWRESLHGMARWRLIINTLTRIRFLHVDGSLDFSHKRGIEEAPDDLVPWFAHPLRRTADTLVAFGHWSALGLITRHNLLALDTGCVWGGELTAVEITPEGTPGEVIQVTSATSAEI